MKSERTTFGGVADTGSHISKHMSAACVCMRVFTFAWR